MWKALIYFEVASYMYFQAASWREIIFMVFPCLNAGAAPVSSRTCRISPPSLPCCLELKSPGVLHFIHCSERPWSIVGKHTSYDSFSLPLFFIFLCLVLLMRSAFKNPTTVLACRNFHFSGEWIHHSESACWHVISPVHWTSLGVLGIFRAP